MTGRASTYTEEMADRICERLSLGESLIQITNDDAMPSEATVYRWLRDEALEPFRQDYARAREAQADHLFDEMQEIADDGRNDWIEKRNGDDGTTGWALNGEAVARSKLRLEDRRWRAGKLRPKKYGDAALIKLADADGEKLQALDVEARVMAIVLAAAVRDAGDD